MNVKVLRARDLMQREVRIIEKSETLSNAARKMHDFGVSSLVVKPDEDGDAFGIITRKDIIEGLVSHEIDGTLNQVEDAMSKPAITVQADLSIYNCQQMMRMVGVRRLPVVDGNRLVGILSNSDIFDRLIDRNES